MRPGIEIAALDRRLGKMIENEALTWEPLYKFCGYGEMPGANQDVDRKSVV